MSENGEGVAPPIKTFDEAFRQLQMTPEEAEELESVTFERANFNELKREPVTSSSEAEEKTFAIEPEQTKETDPNALPAWLALPPDLKIPPDKQIGFMLFRSQWTDRPSKGDRQCLMWPLSDADEKFALKRTRGDMSRGISELAKQMIRAVDGKKIDWAKNSGKDLENFWDEIGAKCRQQIQNYYLKTHALTKDDQLDFFVNCLVVRTSKVGG